MQANKYIGDEAFNKMLEHYACPTPLSVVKMRFCGAICSPNLKSRPADVISSLWPEGAAPRLETKAEADLFFKFFMGLWDEIFDLVNQNKIKLSSMKESNITSYCQMRYDEIELGFVEGFFGGEENLQIPGYLAQIVDSLSELALACQKIGQKGDSTQAVWEAVWHTEQVVEKSIAFIIQNSVLPRIDQLKRQVN